MQIIVFFYIFAALLHTLTHNYIMKKVVCVHTAMALVGPLTEIFHEYFPEVQVEHIAESSLIKEVIANNSVTVRRLVMWQILETRLHEFPCSVSIVRWLRRPCVRPSASA